jgi:hypothetical protein
VQLIAEAIRNGDLRQYAKDIEGDLRKVERESIADYVHESENLAQLHMQIRSCDEQLEGMEHVLAGFQAGLGKVCEEIKALQQRASDLSVKGRNRKDANARLAALVDRMAVSPLLIYTITEAEVNEAYIEHVLSLKKKLQSVDTAGEKPSGSVNVRTVLDNLKWKAVEKSRAFLLQKIYALGRPKTNFQILQNNVLLRFKYLLEFLRLHQPSVYEEVRGEYIQTMSEVYSSLFKVHSRRLARCTLEAVSSGDTIASEETTPSHPGKQTSLFASPFTATASPFSTSIFGASLFGGSPARASPARLAGGGETGGTGGGGGGRGRGGVGGVEIGGMFVLKGRECVLEADGVGLLMATQAAQEGGKHRSEALYKACLSLVVESAAAETHFVSDFFQNDKSNIVGALMKSSIGVVEEHLKAQLDNCYDTLALMLMIRVTQAQKQEIQDSDAPGGEGGISHVISTHTSHTQTLLMGLLDTLTILLWPRFKALPKPETINLIP